MAFGQLVQGYAEAQAEQKEQRDGSVSGGKRVVPATPDAEKAREERAPVSNGPGAPQVNAYDAPLEGPGRAHQPVTGCPWSRWAICQSMPPRDALRSTLSPGLRIFSRYVAAVSLSATRATVSTP